MAIESWRYANPERVYERIQAQEQARAARTPEAKKERAILRLKESFKEAPDDEVDKRG